jgi:UDP-glucuronate 4-epimerase
MRILVTGAAGFIGFHVVKKLLNEKYKVIGIDNFNKYYDIKLKKSRYLQLKKLKNKNLGFFKIDIQNNKKINKLFKKYKFDYVINLAAQAGVRYSISNPESYLNSNIIGFYNILRYSVKYHVKHLVVASSSSVYGEQLNIAKEEKSDTDKPLQFYAATKKSNELMAHSYSNIYKIPITILRFFTVYGPWGRPDMALFKFTRAMMKNEKIYLYNKGHHYRDFTYVDDIVDGVTLALKRIPKIEKNISTPLAIFNLGNGKTVYLKNFLLELQKQLKIKAKIIYLKKQKGDVFKTLACIKKAKKELGYNPKINYKKGITQFLSWYKHYSKNEILN